MPDLSSQEQVTVYPAPAALQDRARCLILRGVPASARGAPTRARIHANVNACLNVVTRGRVASGGRTLPGAFLCGPFSRPIETEVRGELVSASLVLQPWMLPSLTGLPAAAATDRVLDADGLQGALLQRLRAACALACGSPDAVPAVWSVLAEAASIPAPAALQLHLLLSCGVAAAAAAAGCSARQYQRRFQAVMGLAPRVWRRLARWERATPAMLSDSPLAEVAHAFGYADQAHFTRETRGVAGSAPARLRSASSGEGASWALRPARVRSVQD